MLCINIFSLNNRPFWKMPKPKSVAFLGWHRSDNSWAQSPRRLSCLTLNLGSPHLWLTASHAVPSKGPRLALRGNITDRTSLLLNKHTVKCTSRLVNFAEVQSCRLEISRCEVFTSIQSGLIKFFRPYRPGAGLSTPHTCRQMLPNATETWQNLPFRFLPWTSEQP